ncbi:MAG TPA: biopolymer transporter ExbD [Longimicrobiaceae bacterium]|nr:biopolymer transporter ExbD [Longimicrobiaceae bacterium]
MPRRRQQHSSGLVASAEINVTSLVDVAFTLLVIFIITAPILQGGVEVSVPRAEAAPITSPDGVVVTITREGQIFIGDAPASWEEFSAALPEVVRREQARSIYLRADEGVPYGRVLQVLGAMKALDVATVGLVAEPEPAPARTARRP